MEKILNSDVLNKAVVSRAGACSHLLCSILFNVDAGFLMFIPLFSGEVRDEVRTLVLLLSPNMGQKIPITTLSSERKS